jgi:hypothetical protein
MKMSFDRMISIIAARINPVGLTASISLVALLILSIPSLAQTLDTGTIRGQVLDQNRAIINNAEVALTNQVTGLHRETYTDGGGYYTIAGLPLTGKYKLSIKSLGFATHESSDIELRAGVAASFDVILVPEGGKSEVIVSGTTEGIQADSSQLGTRLDLQKIDNTPIFGRKITNLVQLDSAVRPARGTGDLFLNNFLFIVNGGGRRQTTYTLDGSTGDDVWGRQTLFTNIPLSALQEFTVLTNSVSAEYGRTAGSVVNIVTKSGTNDYHFDFVGLLRPGNFQARAPLALQRTADRLTQASGIVSGPITKDHTYFLFGVEYNHQRRDSTITSLLAPGVFTGRYQQGLMVARIDHQFNARHTLTGRLNLDRFTDTNPADAVGGNNLPSAARTFHRRTYAAQLSEIATLNPSMVNEARVQMQVGSPITEFEPVALSTQFVRPGLSTEGESRSTTLINHQYQFADTLSVTRGRQYIKLGGDAIFSTSGGTGQEFGSGFALGQFSFRGNSANVNNPNVPTSNLTLADVQRFTQSFGNANYNVREWLWSLFVQDNVRLLPSLTLNIGLRYERETFTDDQNNLAPRMGFAYNLLGDARTVLRGSYGIYYSEIRANAGAQYAINGPVGIFTFSAAPGQLGFPTSFAPLPSFPAGAVLPPRDVIIRPGQAAFYNQFFDASKLRGYPDKLLNPYTQQATFGIERELPGKLFLNVDYVYAHTIGIDRLLDLNAPALFVRTSPAQVRSAAAADATRPIAPVPNGFRRIQVTVNEGSSVYNGMQLNLNKRFSHNFSVLASYTYSHTINTVEPDAPGGDPNDVNQTGRLERGNSLLDQRHRAVISGWWQLPVRFVLGGATTLASGRPYNITTGVDNNGDGATTDRPVINGTVIGRNTGRGTPVYDLAMFVEREFNLTEKLRLSLRAEAFNLFNHPNIVARNGVSSAATFGQGIGGINGVDPGRQFQFQLRLRY